MGWLRRSGAALPPHDAEPLADGPGTGVVQSAPGMAALLASLDVAWGGTVLDLGPASDGNLRCFGRFARRIRFADLAPAWRAAGSLGEALNRVRRQPGGPYDLVLAWDFLDQVAPEERPGVVAWLGDITHPGARLHLLVDMSDEAFVRPSRFTVVDPDHVRRDDTGPPQPAQPRPLPAEVERLLDPFRLVHAFVLRNGMREYLAVRR